MSLQKIIENNPGFEFSDKATSNASKEVLDNAITSKLQPEQYNLKYADQVSSNKSASTDAMAKPIDEGWKSLLKINPNQKNMDSIEEPKMGFYNEEGQEMVAED